MLNWISLIWDLKPCQISVKCGVGCRCFLHPMCFTNIWDSNCFKEFSFKVYPCRPLFVYEFCGFPPSVTSALSCLHFLLLPPFFFVFYCRFFRVVVSYAGIIVFFFFHPTSLSWICWPQKKKASMWTSDVIQTCIRVICHWINRLRKEFCSHKKMDS